MLRTIATVLVAGAAAVCAQTSETIPFRAVLSPANEVPAVSINASGAATVWLHVNRDAEGRVTSASTDFNVSFRFPSRVQFTGLHIHRGRAGENGPVTIDSGIRGPEPVVSETGQGVINRQGFTASSNASGLDTVNGMLSDPSAYYVNLHSTEFPGGVVRGQLQRANMTVRMAHMNPRNEVPAITDLTASGIGTVVALTTHDANGALNSAQVTFDANYTGFPEGTMFTGFHIHSGPAGVNGPVTVNTGMQGGANAVPAQQPGGNLHYEVEVPMENAAAVATIYALMQNPESQYINLHTMVNPGGAIRGQLRSTDTVTFPVRMLPSNEVPAISGLDATGTGSFTIHTLRNSTGSTTAAYATFDVNHQFAGNTTFTGLHIHNGKAGENGPVSIDSGIRAPGTIVSESGTGNILRAVTVSTAPALAAVNSLLATPENHYINLHTTTNPGGAVRAQLASAAAGSPRVGFVASAISDPSMTTVACGGLMTIYGSDLARFMTQVGSSVSGDPIPTSFNGVQVMLAGRAVPLLTIAPGYIVAQVPVDAPTGAQPLTVQTPGGTSAAYQVTVANVAPAIFFDAQGGLVTDAGYNLVGRPGSPAPRNMLLHVFSTGLGVVRGAGTGMLAPGGAGAEVDGVTVTIDGRPARVVRTIAMPGFLGLYQTTFAIPGDVRSGSVPLQLGAGNTQSNTVTVLVQ